MSSGTKMRRGVGGTVVEEAINGQCGKMVRGGGEVLLAEVQMSPCYIKIKIVFLTSANFRSRLLILLISDIIIL